MTQTSTQQFIKKNTINKYSKNLTHRKVASLKDTSPKRKGKTDFLAKIKKSLFIHKTNSLVNSPLFTQKTAPKKNECKA